MAATMQQFVAESGKLLKPLYGLHYNSRSGFKAAVEVLSVKKMPAATEDDRRKFVMFALKVFDLMRAAGQCGISPNQPVAEVGKKILEEVG